MRRPFVLSDWTCGRCVGKQKSLRGGDPGGLDHDDCVKRLASRRPPAGKRRKGKVDSTQSCAAPWTGLHVSVKATGSWRYDDHARINAQQSRFCQYLIPSAGIESASEAPVCAWRQPPPGDDHRSGIRSTRRPNAVVEPMAEDARGVCRDAHRPDQVRRGIRNRDSDRGMRSRLQRQHGSRNCDTCRQHMRSARRSGRGHRLAGSKCLASLRP